MAEAQLEQLQVCLFFLRLREQTLDVFDVWWRDPLECGELGASGRPVSRRLVRRPPAGPPQHHLTAFNQDLRVLERARVRVVRPLGDL